MKTIKKICILFFLPMMTGCGYYPQMVDVPLIREKNDLRIDAGISLIPAVHATVSYGLTNVLTTQVAGNINLLSIDKRIGNYVQGAVGMFKNYQNRQILELYGGFGFGYLYDKNPIEIGVSGDNYPEIFDGNYQQYFIQFNYGMIRNQNFEYGVALKTGGLHFDLANYNAYNVEYEDRLYSRYNKWAIFVEPVAFMRVGGENLKFDIKISNFLTSTKKFPYIPLNIGIGINYRL